MVDFVSSREDDHRGINLGPVAQLVPVAVYKSIRFETWTYARPFIVAVLLALAGCSVRGAVIPCNLDNCGKQPAR